MDPYRLPKSAVSDAPNTVEVRDLWKRFLIRHDSHRSLELKVMSLFQRRYREKPEEFWVLKGINLKIRRGEGRGVSRSQWRGEEHALVPHGPHAAS